MEEEVGHPQFAFGHLLNLIQVRVDVAAQGMDLDEVVAQGTPTSRFWLDKWMSAWTVDVPSLDRSNEMFEKLDRSS